MVLHGWAAVAGIALEVTLIWAAAALAVYLVWRYCH